LEKATHHCGHFSDAFELPPVEGDGRLLDRDHVTSRAVFQDVGDAVLVGVRKLRHRPLVSLPNFLRHGLRTCVFFAIENDFAFHRNVLLIERAQR